MADDRNQGAGENARNQAALAAYDRQRSLRERHAAFVQQRQNLAGNAEQVLPQGRGGGRQQPSHRFGAPPPAPQLDDAAGDLAPRPPQLATDTANAFAAATQAMQAIAESIGNSSANNSRGRDGDIVINKDVSQVFDEVPEDILDRVKYVKSVVNRLTANTSGVRFKTDSELLSY